MDKRPGRGQTTRQAIIGHASRLFAGEGYEATSIEAVLTACGISRGALYHHFPGKEALFRAVLEAAEAQVAAHVKAAAETAANPLDALRAGCTAWLELAATDQSVRRIVLTDAPSVLGWQAWRQIDSEHSLGLIKAALSRAAEAGRIPAGRVDTYAHLLLAGLVEAALLLARAPADASTIAATQDVTERLLCALFAIQPNGNW